MKKFLTAVALIMWIPSAATAETPVRTFENGKVLLLQAQKEAARLRSISYTASYLGDGAYANQMPIFDGTVTAATSSSDKLTRVKINGTRMQPRANQPSEFDYVNSGRWVTHIDHGKRSYDRGATTTVQRPEEDALFPPYYLASNLFVREIKAASVNMLKDDTVEGVGCYVVEVDYDKTGRSVATFAIGKQDLLVRRVIEFSRATPTNAKIFMARKLVANPSVDSAIFEPLSSPTAYRTMARPATRRANAVNRSGNGLLAKGSKAPDWTLPNENGEEVSLKSLNGQVVVIDFWASWCGPCKMAMPYLQELSNKYQDKAVKVYSINCRERGSDVRARQYLKTKGFTYPQLFKGDDAANDYLVRGIPTIYVIGTDGKILLAERGFRPQKMDEISKVIDEQLNKRQARASSKSDASNG